jgi:hypothetical protein
MLFSKQAAIYCELVSAIYQIIYSKASSECKIWVQHVEPWTSIINGTSLTLDFIQRFEQKHIKIPTAQQSTMTLRLHLHH